MVTRLPRYAFFIAINRLLFKGVAEPDIRGQVLLQELRETSFLGITGEVSFDEFGDRVGTFELQNLQKDPNSQLLQTVVVGLFSTSTGHFSFSRNPVWMDGSAGIKPPQELSTCIPGYYEEEQTRHCRVCPKGMMCTGGASAGFEACPRGTFANMSGMLNCTPCPEGHFARDVGSVECSPCVPGMEAPHMGMEECTKCKPGRYMPSAGASQCLPCGQSQITLQSGADSLSSCLCAEGSFMCPNVGCMPCSSGLHCPAGLSPPGQKAGFWADPGAFASSKECVASVLRCRSASECPKAALGTCAHGRHGRACNNCQVGHFPDFDGSCQACGETDVLLGALFIAVVLIALFSVSLMKVEPSQLSVSAQTQQ